MQLLGEQLVISSDFARRLAAPDPFTAIMALEGDLVREGQGRRTRCTTIGGRAYFAKIHTGVGWREILKNLMYLRLPVVSARTEWEASRRLADLGVRVPHIVAFGQRGLDPSRLRSFIVTEAILGTISLDDLSKKCHERPPFSLSPDLKRLIINDLARIARTLHENGINHRDFYLGHFLIEERTVHDPVQFPFTGLHLLDLHRVQMRRRIPSRWRVKDIAGLLFSSMDAPVSKRDLLRFMRRYRNSPLRRTLRDDALLWRRVHRAATRLYRREHGRPPAGPLARLRESADVPRELQSPHGQGRDTSSAPRAAGVSGRRHPSIPSR